MTMNRNDGDQGRDHKVCPGTAPTLPYIFSLSGHLLNINNDVNVVLLIKLQESPLCGQIMFERRLFVGTLGLCTPPKIFERRLFVGTLGLCTPPKIFVRLAPDDDFDDDSDDQRLRTTTC